MLIHDIGIIFVTVCVLGIIFRLLKQPIIPAYVLAGVIIGPLCMRFVNHPAAITELSEIAVVMMLFVIGIEMDLSRLKKVGLVAVIGGTIQVILTFFIGFGISKAFGLSNVASAYFGCGLSFSSTMLVIKILSEKYDMNTLYGRIVVGILIMQDIFAIFALAILSTVDNFSGQLLLSTVTLAAGLILIVIFVLGKYVFPKLFAYAARERELLFILSMGILFGVGFYAESQKLSLGIGSFLGGIAIARLSYKHEIIGEMKTLKSFFTIIFFAALGLQLAPDNLFTDSIGFYSRLSSFVGEMGNYIWFIIVFGIAVSLIKPLILMIIVGIFGYKKTTTLNTGLSLGHLSEFSLVLIAQGIAAGHVAPELLSPIIIITICSMVLSSYLMNYNASINKWLDKYTNWLERIALLRTNFDFPSEETKNNFEVLVVGCDKLGGVFERALRQTNIKYVIVDSNPEVIDHLIKIGVPCIYGDITTHEVLEQLNFEKIKTVFSTIPGAKDQEGLLRHIEKINKDINFIGITDSKSEAAQLYDLGAHYVLITYEVAAMHLLNSGTHEHAISLQEIIEDAEGVVRKKGKIHKRTMYEKHIFNPEPHPTDETSGEDEE